jgi:hypothetical protein
MSENFTSTEKWWGNTGFRVASADIGVAHGRGLRHLLSHFKVCRYKVEGFFNVPVSSRILESALMLHCCAGPEEILSGSASCKIISV